MHANPEWLAIFGEITADEYLDLYGIERRPWVPAKRKPHKKKTYRHKRFAKAIARQQKQQLSDGAQFEQAQAELNAAMAFAFEVVKTAAPKRRRRAAHQKNRPAEVIDWLADL